MKTANWLNYLMVCGALTCLSTRAATLYVWQDSPSPASPFTNWTAAAHTIQDAVDASNEGDLVLVTNGVYASGGKAAGTNILINRVAVEKPIALQSVNGPQVTIIEGAQTPGGGNGEGAIRCSYLTNGALLGGFTLTNGATLSSGDPITERSGGGVWCESLKTAVLSNCVLTGNSASFAGGGAFSATMHNCTLTRNSAQGGGGACICQLNNCALHDNNASLLGGGEFASTLLNCTLTANAAPSGGGASSGYLHYCVVYFNWPDNVDALQHVVLEHCCTTPMPSDGVGNIGADPQLADSVHVSANSPCRGAGSAALATGTDIDGEAWANPPCIGCDEFHAGTASGPLSVTAVATFSNVATGFAAAFTPSIGGHASVSVWEFGDGVVVSNQPYTTHAWAAPGDYELVLRAYNDSHAEGVSTTQMVHVVAQPVYYVAADGASPTPPYASWRTAATNIQDAVDAAAVPGAVVLVTNGVYAMSGKAVYGMMTNRVAVDKPLTLRSANGPGFTVIQGYQVPDTTNGEGAIRCVYLTNGATLCGFTLAYGATRNAGDYDREQSGGGVWCESTTRAIVSNCVISGNAAWDNGGGAYKGTLNNCTLSGNATGQNGGGSYGSTLNNCSLRRNSGSRFGGGAYVGTLRNCTLTGNSAQSGGGAARGALYNCTLTGNSATNFAGGAYDCSLNNCIVYYNDAAAFANSGDFSGNRSPTFCCTTPMPFSGFGNITDEPLLVDPVGGNLRLQPNSPCINAGNDSYMTDSTDLDGNPRTVSGTVDMGAYEYQGAGSIISYAWLQQYGLPTDGSVDLIDSDGDGQNNWHEWMADTDPTNAASCLRLALLSNSPPVAVTLSSSAARLYTLLWCSNLTPSSVWTPVPGQTNVPGTGDVLTLTDTNPPAPAFYRVSVRFP